MGKSINVPSTSEDKNLQDKFNQDVAEALVLIFQEIEDIKDRLTAGGL